MATADELLTEIACLGATFPTFVSREITKLTEQFVTAVKSFQNPFAKSGDLSVAGLLSEVASLAQGTAAGDTTQASQGMVDQFASGELSAMTPGVLPPPSGNRIQDVLGLEQGIAGNAMMTMSLIPETPFIVAQRMCETLLQVVDIKLENLNCLRRHIIQISNTLLVLMHTRDAAITNMDIDLDAVSSYLAIANAEFTKSRRSTSAGISFDTKAFERGRAALDSALRALSPVLPGGHQSILAIENVLEAQGILPPVMTTAANARISMMVVPQLSNIIVAEIEAVKQQTSVINYYIQHLRDVVNNYSSSPAAQKVIAIRLQTVDTLLARLTRLKTDVDGARANQRHYNDLRTGQAIAQTNDRTNVIAAQMIPWSSALLSAQALAAKIQASQFVAGSLDAATDKAMKATYGELTKAFDEINSDHVVKGIEDVTDLAAKCTGIAKQAKILMSRMDDLSSTDADLKTFQVIVSGTAIQMNGILGTSIETCIAIKAAVQPMILLSILARPSIDNMIDALNSMGLDRAKDTLSVGLFADFMGMPIAEMSYLGAAIKCMTGAANVIDDAFIRRKLTSIRDDLVAKLTNLKLFSMNAIEFGGLRKSHEIRSAIAAIQKDAETVKGIVKFLTDEAKKLGAVVSTVAIDAASLGAMAASTDHLAIGAGGRFASDIIDVSRPSAGVPAC